jgi:hypothetical protein
MSHFFPSILYSYMQKTHLSQMRPVYLLYRAGIFKESIGAIGTEQE